MSVTTPAAGVYSNSAACPTTVDYSRFSAGNQVNGKFKPLYYLSLGGAVIANYAMGSSTDTTNPTECKFGAFSLFETMWFLVVIQTVILLVNQGAGATPSSSALPCLVEWLINIFQCQLLMV